MSDQQPPSDLHPADRQTLLRSASLAWTASTVLLGVGLLLVAAFFWEVVRGQQRASQFVGFPGEEDVSFATRIDILSQGSFLFLAYAAIVIAAALALRMLADLAAVRVGGFSTRQEIGWGQATEIALEPEDDS